MPYDIKNYKGTSTASVVEGTVNSQTPLKLVGQNYKNYGSLIAENFVHLLENFSRDVEPTNAMVGQLWYKPTDGYLYILDQDAAGNKKWKSLATMQVQNTDPTAAGSGYAPREGDFWFNSATDKGILNIRYKDDETGDLKWGQLSVPVSSDATLLFQNVNDDTATNNTAPVSHATIKFVVDNKVLAILSSDDKTWKPNDAVATVQPTGSSTTTVYGIETHPDGTALANEFPSVRTGLTLAQPYDPDTTDTGVAKPGYEYPLKFDAPSAGGTRAEAYPLIDAATGTVTDVVITNKGSGYTSNPQATIDAGQNNGTPATFTVQRGTDTDNDDKVISVTVATGGTGYYTPPRKPTLNGSIRVGAETGEFLDLRGIASGFGRSIVDVTIVNGGSGYAANEALEFSSSGGETAGGSGATGWQVGTVDGSGKILTITKGQVGSGFTYAPSTANGVLRITTSSGSNASLLAVLGDNRMILDPNAISGDKIHGGNISAFESSAISDLTNWQFNDPGIGGLTLQHGSPATSMSSDVTNHAFPSTITVAHNTSTADKLHAGYAEINFDRDQTLGTTSGAVTANGSFRVKGGAHVQKNLHVNGSMSVSGTLYTGGSINSIETNNLTIEDNLIELNKSQSDLGNSSAFGGVSGLYIDRGKTSATDHVKKAIMLWDDTNDDFGDADYWKFGTVGDGASSTGITESTTPADPEDGSLPANTVSGFELIELDTRLIMASQGGKLDVVSDNRSRAGSNSGRSKGGHLTKYNGFDQDITSTNYPYNADSDFIIVDQDERILRGEFHFYRDAYPCDGSDLTSSDAFPGANMNQGGISSTKVGGDVQITLAGTAVTDGTDVVYMLGSGGPNFQGEPMDSAEPPASTVTGGVTVTGNVITAGGNLACTSAGFLDDPVFSIDGGKGFVSLFREGRTIGWRRPRVVIHDSAGTGGYLVPSVGPDGTLNANPAIFTKGKYYSSNAPIGAVVGEANDTVTSAGGPASGGKVTITATSGVITGVTKDANGTNFRKEKPFKEINATKFNGAFCADPAQGDLTVTNKLAHAPGNDRSSSPTTGTAVADSDNKFVGVYPVMDGHNDSGITSETFPYKGAGMTVGTQYNHFIDTFTRNVRVENPHNSTEELTILSRNTNANGTSAKAKVNIIASSANVKGQGDILIRSQGGTDTGATGTGNVVIESRANGANSTTLIQAISGSNAAGTTADGGTTTLTLKAAGGTLVAGGNAFPYADWKYIPDDGATHTPVTGSGGSKMTGSDINLQATDSVTVRNAVGTGAVKRFEVDANHIRFNGDIILGDSTLDTINTSPANSTTWNDNIFFGANIASNVYPDFDSNGSGGFDLGAYKDDFTINDHANNSSGTAPNQRWRTIYVRKLSAGANDQTGTIEGDWSLTSGSTLQSTYTADLAERYEADGIIEPGTVVSIGGDKEITETSKENDTEVFGVISTDPAFIMNGKAGTNETHPMVAMTGRCPCKVKGKINKGDRLVSSSTKGRARKADLTNDSVFAIIGRALEAHDSDGEGTIEIAVTRN